jgi:hypothetical protein
MTMKSCCHSLAAVALLVGVMAETLATSPAWGANAVRNPGFDTLGRNGSPVTLSGPPAGTESAAAEWVQGLIPGGTFMTTELLPSTDPLPGGGGQMLHFFTDSVGFGSAGCVVGQDLSPAVLPLGSWGCLDLRVISGVAHVGFVDSCCGGTFYDSGGVWIVGPAAGQRVAFTNFDYQSGAFEIQLYAPQNGQGEMFMDNACAFPREAGFGIDWFTVDGGGGASQGGDFQVTGTIGQPDAAQSSGNGYELVGGFWGGAVGTPTGLTMRGLMVRAGNQLTLSWPSSADNVVLQQTPQMSPATWTDVALVPTDNGVERSVTLPTTNRAMFYRLKQP